MRQIWPMFLVALLALAGCAGDENDGGAGKTDVSVVPQNHSGASYSMTAKIVPAAGGAAVFEKSYTLGPSDHVGPATKISLAPGTYKADLSATPQAGGETATKTIELTITSTSKQVSLIIQDDKTLDARVG